jgi:hypothetical protein
MIHLQKLLLTTRCYLHPSYDYLGLWIEGQGYCDYLKGTCLQGYFDYYAYVPLPREANFS